MKKLLLLLLCVPLIGFSQVRLHDWDNNFYNKYNSSTFQSLEIVHQLIDPNNMDYELFNAAIFYCTNIQRIKYGRSSFKHSPSLEKAAQGHSKDMVTYNFFSHTSTVRGKNSMSDRLASVGIDYGYRAENICYTYESNPTYWTFALEIVDGWMNSAGHRENILNSNYNYLGCGVYYYKKTQGLDGFYVKSTQNFSSDDRNIKKINTNRRTNNTIDNTTNIISRKEINENTSQEKKNILYGDHMFVCNPVLFFYGNINVAYERFSNNNLLSYKFPLKIKYKNYKNDKNNDIIRTGCELKIFPKGHDNIVCLFIAPADYFGLSFQQDPNKNEYFFFNEIQLVTGLNYHPIEWLDITLDASFGRGTLNFDEIYYPFRLGLDIGMRY